MSCHRRLIPFAALVLALGVTGACNRTASESAEPGVRDEPGAVADVERERTDAVAQLRDRVSELEREYSEAAGEVASGEKTATAGLRQELKEDVAAVREAVDDLSTTTPENWWDRHEQALNRTIEDVETDVRRLAGNLPAPKPEAATGTTGERVDSEAFTSRRDAFVTRLRARVEAMERALDDVKAKDARETEVEDTRARVRKMREDLDRLNSATADDWWDLSKERVTEYIDRVEGSIDRLDDNSAG